LVIVAAMGLVTSVPHVIGTPRVIGTRVASSLVWLRPWTRTDDGDDGMTMVDQPRSAATRSDESRWVTVGRAAEILDLDVCSARRRADAGSLGEVWWTLPDRRGHRRISADGVERYRRRLRGDESAPSSDES